MNRPDWDHRYRKGEHLDDPPLALLATTVRGLPPGEALDVACGPGRHAFALSQSGWQVTAIDSSQVALDVLRRRAAEAGLSIDIQRADLEKHEFHLQPGKYDLIVDAFYLQRDLLPEIRAGLRPGGVFFGVIHVDDPDAPPDPSRFLLQPGELLREFPGWEILHYAAAAPQLRHRRVATELVCRKPE